MRSLALALALALALPAAAQDAGPPDAGTWIPPMPDPVPARYVAPLELLGDLPRGRVSVAGDLVCLDAQASARSAAILGAAEGLSDQRAAASWRRGWRAGARALLPRLEEEHSGRVAAEALRRASHREEEPSIMDSVLTFPLTPLAILAAGFAVGYGVAR